MSGVHFLNMYVCTGELEKTFKSDTCLIMALQVIKTYLAELFITVDIQAITEKEFFDLWSSKTPVEYRIRRTQAFKKFVRDQGIVITLDDDSLDIIAEGATKALKILYDMTKPDT